MFPEINHISDVLPSLVGHPEFLVVQKEGHTVVDYCVALPTSFVGEGADIRRECRGLIFCSVTGKVLARRYHKFFNIGEHIETMPILTRGGTYWVLNKADGSLFTGFRTLDGVLRWGSMMGETDFARVIVPLVTTQVQNLALQCIDQNMTAIFEYCSPVNRIVVAYDSVQFILTGIRHNNTGDYLPYPEVLSLGTQAGVDVIKMLPGSGDLESILQEVPDLTGTEGCVITFEDGFRAKLKSAWYVNLHRVVTNIRYPKDVAVIILNKSADDILATLPEPTQKLILRAQEGINQGLLRVLQESVDFVNQHFDRNALDPRVAKKTFAEKVRQLLPSDRHALVYQATRLDPIELLNWMVEQCLDHMQSNFRYNQIKYMWGGKDFTPGENNIDPGV